MKPLSPRNPLDYLRLLWWLCVTPQHIKAYREAFGRKDERRVGKWLTSTLLWLPFFLPALALAMGTLPLTNGGKLPDFTRVSFGIFGLWLLTGLLTETQWRLMFIGFLITAFGLVATLPIVTIGVSRTPAPEYLLPLAIILAMYLSGPLAEAIVYEAIVDDGEGQLGFGAAYFMGIVYNFGRQRSRWSAGTPGPVQKSVETGHSSLLMRGGFVVCILLYAFIVWVSFLDGWRIFA